MDERTIAAAIVIAFVLASAYFLSASRNVRVSPPQEAWAEKARFQEDPQDAALRQHMVDELQGGNITDQRLLEAVGGIPRHLFLPEELRQQAYTGFPLPIGFNRTTPQPYYVAYVVQAVHPGPKERVLEAGTGSGYQTAVLASLSAEVYSVEKEGKLAEDASKTLKTLGIENAHVREGDPLKGWPDNAPYDVIIVNNAVSEIPDHLSGQLAPEGRMIFPLRESDAYQRLTLVSRTAGTVETQALIIVRYDPF